jgi:4-hydroxy-tetrahydrodipicolinate synthase
MSFSGVIPALMTAFDEGLALAPEHITANAEFLKDNGIEHVIVCGTMGEAQTLSTDERRQVIDLALATGLTVSVGVSAPTTAAAVANIEQAAEAGAYGVMCLPPTTYDATEREVLAFFDAVCGASDLPVMLYNNPEASRHDLPAALIASVPGISAVKECSGDARRIAQLLELSDLDVLVGGDDWALEGYAAGAVGWVSGVANVFPAECIALEAHVATGELAEARALWPKLAPLSRLDMDPRLVQSFKAALDLSGRYGGPVRPPRLPLDTSDMERVVDALGLAAAGSAS